MAPIRPSVNRTRTRGNLHASRGRDKKPFQSSRVQELEPNFTKSPKEHSLSELSYGSDTASSDDGLGKADFYNILMRDLKSEQRQTKPPKKKRKTSPRLQLSLGQDDVENQDGAKPRTLLEAGTTPDQMEDEDSKDLFELDTVADELGEVEDDPQDPYEDHFVSNSGGSLATNIADMKAGSTQRQKGLLDHDLKVLSIRPSTLEHSLAPAQAGGLSRIEHAFLKSRIRSQAAQVQNDITKDVQSLSRLLFAYEDVMFCERTIKNAQSLRNQACIHALNHVLKTRDKIIKNNSRLAKADVDVQTEYRDQGFTRPKVLMLLPTREACARAVETIVKLFEPEQQENRGRFTESFSQPEEASLADKPRDFRDLFGGNDDDMFRLGVKITRKTIKFFSHFYNSDFIFASPLGLKMAIGSEDSKDFDRDFLSSIEVVVLDHGDVLLMQNWEHLAYIFDQLNAQPKDAHGCDFSRVRDWYLEGNSRYLRQTVVFSSFNTPELNQIFNLHMLNVSGKHKISRQSYPGVIGDIVLSVKQTFSRFDASSPSGEPESRFKYFTNTTFAALRKHARSVPGKAAGILLFIPSYMDFVRVRNFLASSVLAQNISFGAISEYTSVSETARARSHFFYGRQAVLLYTGRAHHFRRYKIRGVKKVFMYGLPENPLFYREVAGDFLSHSVSEGIADATNSVINCIFSKWDLMKLERIVGTRRVMSLIQGNGSYFEFS